MATNDYQGMGLSNGQTNAGVTLQDMGAIDPSAMTGIPQLPDMGPEPAPVEPKQDELRKLVEAINIAEDLDEEELRQIAQDALEGYRNDLSSREDWERHIDDWTKLASQVVEQKTYPWPDASNVKYPLISVAAMQFNARAYPSLIPSDGKVVKTQVIGKDPTGEKKERADRISTYMSYQLMYEMAGWEAQMDKLFLMLPIVGTVFKKTYFDPISQKNCSHLVLPKNLVVDYWASCLEDAERITEILELSPRCVKEKQLAGIFLDVELHKPQISLLPEHKEVLRNQEPPQEDSTTPYLMIEQHTYLDLNDDGYPEPYIVTVDVGSEKVLRIVARYDDKTITTNKDGKVIRIEPIHYYTKYDFIPNPDGGFYSIGFGHLLGPLNEAVNSLMNQLIDAGTLANLQSGFIGKGLRLRMGETRLQPGEWRAVNSTGDDLRKQIVPLPMKEPSNVLFQLMGSLVTAGKELASVAEIFVGKMPGQNTPATTTMATIEQGMKVFTAVYKRVYRSLESEFKKLFRLNEVYLDYDTYVNVLDINVNPTDFDSNGYDVCPAADPAAISQTEKLVKAQALMELLPTGILDPLKVTERLMDALEIPNWQDLISPSVGQPQQQQPDPVAMEMQMKAQAEQQKSEIKMQELAMKSNLSNRDMEFKHQMEAYKTAENIALEREKARNQADIQAHKDGVNLAINEVKHAQRTRQSEELHKQKLAQAKENTSSSQNKTSPNGGKTKSRPSSSKR